VPNVSRVKSWVAHNVFDNVTVKAFHNMLRVCIVMLYLPECDFSLYRPTFFLLFSTEKFTENNPL